MQPSQPFIFLFVVAVFIVGGLLYLYNPTTEQYEKPPEDDGAVFCTADAKLCPDGSYVGRTGPNCEFICPDAAPNSGNATTTGAIIDFEGCARAGNPVMESYPRQCRTAEGKLFVEEI